MLYVIKRWHNPDHVTLKEMISSRDACGEPTSILHPPGMLWYHCCLHRSMSAPRHSMWHHSIRHWRQTQHQETFILIFRDCNHVTLYPRGRRGSERLFDYAHLNMLVQPHNWKLFYGLCEFPHWLCSPHQDCVLLPQQWAPDYTSLKVHREW